MLQLDSYSRTKRPVADFVARNRRAVKKKVPVQKKEPETTPRPAAGRPVASQRKAPPHPVPSKREDKSEEPGGHNDTVVISKGYLESLLKQSVLNRETAGNDQKDMSNNKGRRTRKGSDREDGGSGHQHVVVIPTSVPGLTDPQSSSSPPKKYAPNSTGRKNSPAGHKPNNSSSKAAPTKNGRGRGAPPAVEEDYFPFGRPGCGAPLRTVSGNVVADLRTLAFRNSHMGHIQDTPSSPHRSPSPIEEEVHVGVVRSTADHAQPDHRRTDMEESSSPRYARGVGPHVDHYMLREKAEKRKKELEHKKFLKEQMELKQRAKKEAKEKVEREEKEEELRLARERRVQQEEYRRDMEKAAKKEEESRRRQSVLQEAIEKAAEEAAHVKLSKSRTSRPNKRRQDPTNHTVTFDLRNSQGNGDSGIDAVSSKYQLRSSSLLHMTSGEDTPPPSQAWTNRQPCNDGKKRGSKIPVSSRHLTKEDGSRRKKPEHGRRRSDHPPSSPPVPTVARKLHPPSDNYAPSQANWKPREGHAMRVSSPPVPALARKMRHAHKEEVQGGLEDGPLLNSTFVRDTCETRLPQVVSQRPPASPPVPAVKKQLECQQLPPIPQSSSVPVLQHSGEPATVPTLPSIVPRPPADGPGQSYDRQREILQQLAQLRTGLLSHCSEVDGKLDALLNRTKPL